MRWDFRKFENLSGPELYGILSLRQQVFVVEQKCAYLDTDGLDTGAFHLFGTDGSRIVAYLRILSAQTRFQEVSFGRVAVLPDYRGRSLGQELVRVALEKIEGTFGKVPVRISAQVHLSAFYGKFGFAPIGEGYLLDGIPHIEMLRR